jgi:hypothetical protein
MTGFVNRDRYNGIDAQNVLRLDSNMILHVMRNDDDSYSVVGHIVCEMCDLCYAQGDARGQDIDTLIIGSAIENIYTLRDAAEAEWDRQQALDAQY